MKQPEALNFERVDDSAGYQPALRENAVRELANTGRGAIRPPVGCSISRYPPEKRVSGVHRLRRAIIGSVDHDQ